MIRVLLTADQMREARMIRIPLTAAQIREANEHREISLTDRQMSSLRGKLNAAARIAAVTCTCGDCSTCKARERKRRSRSLIGH
jgi:hypothetical protein